MSTMSEKEKELTDSGLWTPFLSAVSAQWDNDWNRATFCYDPWRNMPLKGVTYTHGMLNGLWQGRMLVSLPPIVFVHGSTDVMDTQVPIEEAYMGLMGMPHRPPNFGEGNPQITTVPLYMRLREHHCINPQLPIRIGGKRNGFDDGLENAWLPPFRMRESDVCISGFVMTLLLVLNTQF
jgi:hypothetical protein